MKAGHGPAFPGRGLELPGHLPKDIPGPVGLLPAGRQPQVQIQQIGHAMLIPGQGTVAGKAVKAVGVRCVPGQIFQVQPVAGAQAAHIAINLRQFPPDGVIALLSQGRTIQARRLPQAAASPGLLRLAAPIGGRHIQGNDIGHSASFRYNQCISLPSSALISCSVKVWRVWQK